MQDITIKRIDNVIEVLRETLEYVTEGEGLDVDPTLLAAMRASLDGVPSDALSNLDELVDLFRRSAEIYRAGEESADFDEMMDISERSVALAEKMGLR